MGSYNVVVLALLLALLAAAERDESAWAAGSCYASSLLGQVFLELVEMQLPWLFAAQQVTAPLLCLTLLGRGCLSLPEPPGFQQSHVAWYRHCLDCCMLHSCSCGPCTRFNLQCM